MLFNKVSFVDQEGSIAGLIGVITDVTRYKETERALETSEARFRVLTESSLDLISVMEEDGKIRYQSPALRHLMGFDPAETVGKNVFDMIHRDDVENARAAFGRVIERRSNEPIEFRIRHRDGMWRTFESLGTNCLANPHIGGVVFNSRDITDRKMISSSISTTSRTSTTRSGTTSATSCCARFRGGCRNASASKTRSRARAATNSSCSSTASTRVAAPRSSPRKC